MSLPTREVVEQVKNVTSPLKFFIYMCGVVAILTIGLAGWSKIDPKITQWLVLALFIYFMVISIMSYCLVVYDPKRYLYTREEWLKKENLTDSIAVEENRQISNINVPVNRVELPKDSNIENK